jgi:hypothetical protein
MKASRWGRPLYPRKSTRSNGSDDKIGAGRGLFTFNPLLLEQRLTLLFVFVIRAHNSL